MSDATRDILRSAPVRRTRVRFCSRCGARSALRAADVRLPARRVCEACGLGILLVCAPSALTACDRGFLVAGPGLSITAVSESAEALLGEEDDLLGRPLEAVLAGEDPAALAVAARRAHERWWPPVDLRGRPASGGDLAIRVSPCGHPRAALITLSALDDRVVDGLPPLRSV